MISKAAQFLSQRIINAILHINTVGTDTGLTAITELADHNTLNRLLQIGIIKNQYWRIATQLK